MAFRSINPDDKGLCCQKTVTAQGKVAGCFIAFIQWQMSVLAKPQEELRIL